MTISALIIDDEPLARSIVSEYVKLDPDFTIVGEATDGFDGLKKMAELKPNLIFLDVQMPKITGFEMLELVDEPPMVVFATAYDQYAIKAFDAKAIDYLLKPFSQERFAETLQRVKEKWRTYQPSAIQDFSREMTNQSERIVVKNGSQIVVIETDEVLAIEAYGDYVWIYTETEKFLKQQTLKSFEALSMFAKPHRSFLVGLKHIKKLEKYEKDGFKLILKNGLSVPVSESGYKALKERLNW